MYNIYYIIDVWAREILRIDSFDRTFKSDASFEVNLLANIVPLLSIYSSSFVVASDFWHLMICSLGVRVCEEILYV